MVQLQVYNNNNNNNNNNYNNILYIIYMIYPHNDMLKKKHPQSNVIKKGNNNPCYQKKTNRR